MQRDLFRIGLSLFGLVAGGMAQAQDWTTVPLGTSSDIVAIENTSFSEKWIVGENGYAALSSGGRTVWNQVDVGTTTDLLSVHQPSAGQVWTGAQDGVVRRKIGSNWEGRNIPGTTEDFTLFSRSSGTSWAAGKDGSIYRTTDGGDNWELSYTAGAALRDGSGFIASTAYVVGDEGTILRTTNGGMSWSPLDTGTTADLYAFLEGGQSTGLMAVGEAGTIVRSLDNGATWELLSSGVVADLYALSSSKANTSWLVAVGAGGVIIKSTNGGLDWCRLVAGTNADLFGVEAATNSEYIVTGADGLLLRTTTGGGPCLDPAGIAPPVLDGNLVLHGPFPHPIRSSSRLELRSDVGQDVRVDLLDVTGRKLSTLLHEHLGAGEVRVIGVDGASLTPGVYFVRARADGWATSRSVVVTR